MWQTIAAPTVKRYYGSALQMPDGRVLVVGGGSGNGGCCRDSEIYDPSSNIWTPLGPINPTYGISYPVMLPDEAGAWLVLGGGNPTRITMDEGQGSVYRLDTSSRSSTLLASLQSITSPPLPSDLSLSGQTAIEALDDQHLLFVNFWDQSSARASDRTLTVDRKTWVPVLGPPLEQAARKRLMVKLTDGRLLVLGGMFWWEYFDGGTRQWQRADVKNILESAALSPGQGQFERLGATKAHFMRPHSQLLALPDGSALAVGGTDATLNVYTNETLVESFEPRTNAWTPRGSSISPRAFSAVQWVRDSMVLLAGGGRGDAKMPSQTADILDLATGRWYDAGPMSVPRIGAASVRLADGRILVIGGTKPAPPRSSPSTPTPSLPPDTSPWSRAAHAAETLGWAGQSPQPLPGAPSSPGAAAVAASPPAPPAIDGHGRAGYTAARHVVVVFPTVAPDEGRSTRLGLPPDRPGELRR
ncbi:MAG: hypothetical protein IPJ58_09045 [Ardenticatenia bacterium]|nr:hypothetical protein [Ardenticatenia bacterium]